MSAAFCLSNFVCSSSGSPFQRQYLEKPPARETLTVARRELRHNITHDVREEGISRDLPAECSLLLQDLATSIFWHSSGGRCVFCLCMINHAPATLCFEQRASARSIEEKRPWFGWIASTIQKKVSIFLGLDTWGTCSCRSCDVIGMIRWNSAALKELYVTVSWYDPGTPVLYVEGTLK